MEVAALSPNDLYSRLNWIVPANLTPTIMIGHCQHDELIEHRVQLPIMFEFSERQNRSFDYTPVLFPPADLTDRFPRIQRRRRLFDLFFGGRNGRLIASFQAGNAFALVTARRSIQIFTGEGGGRICNALGFGRGRL
jgi:hypothetical protein